MPVEEPQTRNLNRTQLLAALPALLGYLPQESLLFLTMIKDEQRCSSLMSLGPVLRCDIEPFLTTDRDAQLEHIATAIASASSHTVDTVLLVIISSQWVNDEKYSDEVAQISEAASHIFHPEVHVADTLYCSDIAAGLTCHYSGKTRRQQDPHATEFMAQRVVGGDQVGMNRDELAAYYRTIADRPEVDFTQHSHTIDSSQAITYMRQAHDTWSECQQLDTLQLSGVAHVLADNIAVERIAVDISTDTSPDDSFWIYIAHHTSGHTRAQALVFSGLNRYLHGDGVHARLAFDTALTVHPHTPLARTLQKLIHSGVPPHAVRETLARLNV